ncbi:YtxH domain-containing protein [Solitalea sp. MAHUQ-68]|uniref:YtxH domain-containing protein n=1 Tax=Solitalea agri TaxID=2953739 RepID=A0A9X2F4N0_9SPHI|nr:YtxH domain-containing protein [Solitalea agri]MCO4294642.1 YtxH domain-containing protein [Solitalea agri]
MNNSRSLMALVVGIAAGAALNAMLNSEKGLEFKRKAKENLKRTSDDLMDKFKGHLESGKNQLADKMHQAADSLKS